MLYQTNFESTFWGYISQSETLIKILERSDELQIPNWCFGAGCLAQTVWNLKTGNAPHQFINDVDWVYFDNLDLSEESENRTQKLVQEHFVDIPLKFDVKNQARVHTWYAQKFGYKIPPYRSIEDAIRTWPTTSTAVAISKAGNQYKVFAPFGLEDLLTITARPNKAQITEEIFLSKVKRWKKCWPSLKVIDWSGDEEAY